MSFQCFFQAFLPSSLPFRVWILLFGISLQSKKIQRLCLGSPLKGDVSIKTVAACTFVFWELGLERLLERLIGHSFMSSLMPRECQSGSSSVAWHLHSCWVYEPRSYGRLLFVFNEWHKVLKLMNSVSAPRIVTCGRHTNVTNDCTRDGWMTKSPAASNGISLLWSYSSIYSKKKHVSKSKEDYAKYL